MGVVIDECLSWMEGVGRCCYQLKFLCWMDKAGVVSREGVLDEMTRGSV